jgi:hypothetical protein
MKNREESDIYVGLPFYTSLCLSQVLRLPVEDMGITINQDGKRLFDPTWEKSVLMVG